MRIPFTVTFHGPFRVATGHANPGADVAVDPTLPVPGSSLKGLMRAAARDLLRLGEPAVAELFGTARRPSPWSWSDLEIDCSGRHKIMRRTRVAIDSETGTAHHGGLVRADEWWATSGSFTIDLLSPLPKEDQERHRQLLAAAAVCVRSIGADRNRGFGWVTVQPDNQSNNQAPADVVAAVRTAKGEAA